MNSLYLQYEKLWKIPMKDGKKVNVLCIVDQNHERSVFVLDHFRNFKDIYTLNRPSPGVHERVLILGKN